MENEKKTWDDIKDKHIITTPIKIFWLGIATILIIVLAGQVGDMKRPTYAPSSTPSYAKNSTSTQSQTSQNINLPVTGTVEVRGDFAVVDVRVNNNRGIAVDKTLMLYVIDSTGGRHFVDGVYVELAPGEVGKCSSNIRLSEINGPPPYTFTYQWKN